MRIANLEIRNFKAIRQFSIRDISDAIVLAGPNGCGKSCVLDAIRLLKSTYGGYRRQNEWQSFFNEFQLNLQNPEEVKRLFHNRNQEILIAADFSFSTSELEYIRQFARTIIYKSLWEQTTSRRQRGYGPVGHLGNESEIPDLSKVADEAAAAVIAELNKDVHVARLTIDTRTELATLPSLLLQFVFGIYDPKNIGMIDYHGAHRNYQRERLGGINVNIEETGNKLAQHALFDWQNKYTNIKSELASAYIRDLFIERAGGISTTTSSILASIKDLFETFLPGKTFGGPQPGKNGELIFQVKLAGGGEHDIDDLSSGEKELVYGYLRLRNASPTHSIIMLDEPELHLNPRLVLGLPNFYRKHLGAELSNQLWMVTHSDAFLRDAFRSGGFSIFHMSPADAVENDENQVALVSADSEVTRAIVELVGDIAGLRPGSKIVIFESSESASFDATMTRRLFPDFAERTNSLSGDNKFGVRQLWAALDKAVKQMGLPSKIYAICDRDFEGGTASTVANARTHVWDVFHIENYLLNEQFIAVVIDDYPTYAKKMATTEITQRLKECAVETQAGLVSHQLRNYVMRSLSKCIDLGYDPNIPDPVVGLSDAITRSETSISALIKSKIGRDELEKTRQELTSTLNKALTSEAWRSEFRGRDILRRFAGKYLPGLPYEAFRDAIIARMGDAGHRPPGMQKVIEKILSD
jgi:hypothetical protein